MECLSLATCLSRMPKNSKYAKTAFAASMKGVPPRANLVSSARKRRPRRAPPKSSLPCCKNSMPSPPKASQHKIALTGQQAARAGGELDANGSTDLKWPGIVCSTRSMGNAKRRSALTSRLVTGRSERQTPKAVRKKALPVTRQKTRSRNRSSMLPPSHLHAIDFYANSSARHRRSLEVPHSCDISP